MKTEIRFDRLEQVVSQLSKPQRELAHKQWSFECVNDIEDEDDWSETGCGTVGCAMGEFPAIWPDNWKWVGHFLMGKQGDVNIPEWFGITEKEVGHLFYPYCQQVDKYGGFNLSKHSSKEDVLANLLAFIDFKKLNNK